MLIGPGKLYRVFKLIISTTLHERPIVFMTHLEHESARLFKVQHRVPCGWNSGIPRHSEYEVEAVGVLDRSIVVLKGVRIRLK